MLAYTVGVLEIVLIVLLLVLLFGARKLPELARSLGRSSKEFKAGMRESAVEEPEEETSNKPKPVPPS